MDKLFTLTALAFYGIALLGILTHAVKKWGMHEISYSVYTYLFTIDPRGTLVTIGTALAAVVSAIGTGQIGNLHAFADVSVAFLAGYACDSAIYPANNKTKG